MEEKKKLDQLRKERDEERQMQELERLQEEKTGKKRQERLEWMYATPASGSSQNPNDLEDYLLGKKRVDKILPADENAKVRVLLPGLDVGAYRSFCSSAHPTRTSSLSRMRTRLATLLPRSARTRWLLSSSRSRLLIRLC